LRYNNLTWKTLDLNAFGLESDPTSNNCIIAGDDWWEEHKFGSIFFNMFGSSSIW
jgi:hypothetical protein